MNKKITLVLLFIIIFTTIFNVSIEASSFDNINSSMKQLYQINNTIKILSIFLFLISIFKKLIKIAIFSGIIFFIFSYINSNPEVLRTIESFIK